MFKKRQANPRYRRETADLMLHLRVNSPRIFFYQSRKILWSVCKWGALLALVGFAVFYIKQYISNYLHTDSKYALRHLELKTNGFLNESSVAEIAGINPSGTIFSFDIDDAEARLIERPEVVTAVVERRLPDTVKVTLEERVPVAWVACPKLGVAGRNPLSGILMDANGVLFRCQGDLWTVARDLPVIEVYEAEMCEFPIGQEMAHKDASRALELIEKINNRVQGAWWVDRVVVADFYKLVLTTNDGVKVTFGMYDHDRQLNDLIAARAHAKETGRELEWINLLPKYNIPGNFKESSSKSDEDLTSVND